MGQHFPPGHALGKEFNTKKLVAQPPSATKSFQKIPSVGIGVPKVLSYRAFQHVDWSETILRSSGGAPHAVFTGPDSGVINTLF